MPKIDKTREVQIKKSFNEYLGLNLEDLHKVERDLYSPDYEIFLAGYQAALPTIDPEELARVKIERNNYKLWWEGATETHNQLRKLYDEQNAKLWAILKRPECPDGLAQRMLKMPEADRDYFLSLAVETVPIDPDATNPCKGCIPPSQDFCLTLPKCPKPDAAHDDLIRRETIKLAEKQSREWFDKVSSDYDDDAPIWALNLANKQRQERTAILATEPAREGS